MYLTICVEWAGDQFYISLTQIDPLLRRYAWKKDFYIFVPSDVELWPL